MNKPREVINQLSPQDALVVLKALADSDASLARRIAEIATEHLSEVDPQDVAEEIYYALESLQVEDVWDKAGSTRDGYVEPYEVVDEMIDGAMAPHFDELVRYQMLRKSLGSGKPSVFLRKLWMRWMPSSRSSFPSGRGFSGY